MHYMYNPHSFGEDIWKSWGNLALYEATSFVRSSWRLVLESTEALSGDVMCAATFSYTGDFVAQTTLGSGPPATKGCTGIKDMV